MALDKITLDKRKIAVGLGKACLNAMQGKWWDAAAGVLDAAGLVGLKDAPPPDAEQGLALLLQAGMINAAGTVFQRHRHLSLDAGAVDDAAVIAALDGVTLTPPPMTRAAFTAVEGWEAVKEMRRLFGSWLKAAKIPPEHHRKLLRDFIEEIPISLALTMRARPNDFAALESVLDRATPLDEAARRAANWRRYRLKLIEDTRRPMRRIDKDIVPPFSLADLYVPLYASWTERKGKDREPTPYPVSLHKALHHWFDRGESEDAVRLVAGGPGSGKSSACKMFAAELARANRRVVLVPLGRLDYHAGEAWREVRRYVEGDDELGHDGLDGDIVDDGEPTLLILDGLDELAKAGRLGEVTVRDFVDKIGRAVERLNRDRDKTRLLLLLAGRPGAASETRGVAQVDQARLSVEGFMEIDETDQRDAWWRRFGFSEGLPHQLRNKSDPLDDVTAQPLLNWLLGQVLMVERANNADTALEIRDTYGLYALLLGHVLKRTYRERTGEPLDRIIEKDIDPLAEMLEEISLAAWHEGDRTVSFDTVRERLSTDHADTLDAISEHRELAIRAVLDSFFCAAADGGRHETVEFTHKSFREFLTARRLLRLIEDTVEKLNLRKPDNEGALRDWLALCGPTAIDYDLLITLRAAVATKPPKTLMVWRTKLSELLQITINEGMPPPAETLWSKEADRRARNAEEALLACLDAATLALPAEDPAYRHPLKWGDDTMARARWLNHLTGPVGDTFLPIIAPLCLRNVDFNHIFYHNANLFNSNLEGANLFNSSLKGANIARANLEAANLEGANLFRANLNDTHIYNENIEGANLEEANLARANLARANLFSAIFVNANLEGANLEDANLEDANLRGANLRGAKLRGAKLDGVRGLTEEQLADLRRRAQVKPDHPTE